MARKFDELPIHRAAVAFCAAVTAILQTPALRRNRKLWTQIDDANDSILANMDEGWEQSSDDGFANFLQFAKGSTAEVVSRLGQAQRKRYISEDTYKARSDAGAELQRMLGGFIKCLRTSGFKDRGSFRAKHGADQARELTSPNQPADDDGDQGSDDQGSDDQGSRIKD